MATRSPVEAAVADIFRMIWGDRFDFEDGRHHGDTPERWVRMMRELTNQREEVEFTTFPSDNDEMVMLTDIPFRSLCAHHMVPFVGVVHVAYVPRKKIVGLSKIPRLIKFHSNDLTVQEDLTEKIARDLNHRLDAVGVAVVMKAEHMCMSLRGVQTHDVLTTTSKMMGCFADHSKLARQEFLAMIP